MVQHTVELEYTIGPTYEDTFYTYYGEAAIGTALDVAKWRIRRVTKSTGRVQWAEKNSGFNNLYTNVAVVASLIYG